MQRQIAAAADDETARRSPTRPARRRRRATPAARRPFSAGWRRSDGVSPNGTRHLIVPRFRSIATRWPYGGLSSGRPSMNSALVSPTRVSSASTSDARGFAADRSGFPSRAMFAWFDVFTNSTPLAGSNAPPPQFAPPISPGRCTVPCSVGGVNSGPIRYFASSCCAAAFSSGVQSIASSSVTPCSVIAGGLVGNGCVGHACSPGDVARRHRRALRSATPACR